MSLISADTIERVAQHESNVITRAETIVEMVRCGELSNHEGFELLVDLMADSLIVRNEIQDHHVLV